MGRTDRALLFRCKITEDGAFEFGPRTRKRIKEECKVAFSGKRIILTIKRDRKAKSHAQLGYYYAVVLPYVAYGLISLGNDFQVDNEADMDEIDHFLKEKFLNNGIEFADRHGVAHKGKSSLARTTTTQMLEFVDRVIQFAAEDLSIEIPTPDIDWKETYPKGVKEHLIEKLYAEI